MCWCLCREEDLSRLKKKLAATPSSVGTGKCSCCASTHHGRGRAVGDAGATALKKRALAAEVTASRRVLLYCKNILSSIAHVYMSATIVLCEDGCSCSTEICRVKARVQVIAQVPMSLFELPMFSCRVAVVPWTPFVHVWAHG